jgi:hypothetical protein
LVSPNYPEKTLHKHNTGMLALWIPNPLTIN